MNIIIIGTGAVASELQWFDMDIKGYLEFDYNIEKYWKRYQLKEPILGDIDSYEIQEDDRFVIGMTNIEFRWKMIEKMKARGGKFINLLHPLAIIQEPSVMGEGNIVHPYVMIGANTEIGDFNHFCPQSIIGHDCKVGNNNVLSATILCGHVSVNCNNFFGIRTAVAPHIRIGRDNGIHAGMTVDKDIENNTLLTYEPITKVVVSNYHSK